MNLKTCFLLLCAFCWVYASVYAQGNVVMVPAEGYMITQTKQVNQFFRRFNGEETPAGQRLYPTDRQFRDPNLRRGYLPEMFDLQNPSLNDPFRRRFMNYVVEGHPPAFLDFHGGKWFAEVQTRFLWQGREETLILFMELEEETIGSKWVISQAYFPPFDPLFQATPSEDAPGLFLHPLSHELDFMNLAKALKNREQVSAYAADSFKPDHLSLVLYEIRKGNLTFVTVNNVKFHIFQLPGWYMELKQFNYDGTNRGWLISQLTEVPPGQESTIRNFIYRR